MKFKIHQKDLINILIILEQALPVKSVIESLKGIKIEVEETEIKFTASKNSLAILYTTKQDKEDLEILETGQSIVSGFHLINIIKRLENGYINFEKIGNTLHIKTTKSHIELIEYQDNSYPFINFDISLENTLNFNKETLKLIYEKTKYSISQNQMRQILTGINFNFSKNKLNVSSTDSLRMSFFNTEYISNLDFNFTLAKSIMATLVKIFDNLNEEEINFSFSQNQFIVHTDNIKIKSRLLEGEFPKIETIIPKTINFSFTIDAQELKQALTRVMFLTAKEESVVTQSIENDILKLYSSHKFLGEIEEFCSIEQISGAPFKISFDPQFVLDSIAAINGSMLRFEFVDEVSGFIIKEVDSEDYLNIISPIRMN